MASDSDSVEGWSEAQLGITGSKLRLNSYMCPGKAQGYTQAVANQDIRILEQRNLKLHATGSWPLGKRTGCPSG